MADPNNQYPNALQLFQSKAFIGMVVSFVLGMASLFGKALNIQTVTDKVSAVFGLISLGFLIYAMAKRYFSPVQPLTLTQAKADALNSVPPAPPAPKEAAPFVPQVKETAPEANRPYRGMEQGP